MILNGKGSNWLWSGQSNIAVVFKQNIFCLFVCFVVLVKFSNGGEEEDYIKCELMVESLLDI